MAEIRAESERRRHEHRQEGAAAVSRMLERGEALTAIAELAGVKVSEVRAVLKSAGAQPVAPPYAVGAASAVSDAPSSLRPRPTVIAPGDLGSFKAPFRRESRLESDTLGARYNRVLQRCRIRYGYTTGWAHLQAAADRVTVLAFEGRLSAHDRDQIGPFALLNRLRRPLCTAATSGRLTTSMLAQR